MGVAGLAGWVAWWFFLDHGETATGVGVIVGAVLGVGLAFAVVQGLTGLTPGKALLGLRTSAPAAGRPIGVARALLRGAVLLGGHAAGVRARAGHPGVDGGERPGRQRRGWHDQVAGSVVVDVRPVPPDVVVEDNGPRQVVNLTAHAPGPAHPRPTVARSRARSGAASRRDPGHRSPPARRSHRAPPQAAPEDGRTVVRGRAARPPALRWRVVFDTGEAFVVEGLGLVGRRPEPRPGEPVRHVVPLPSADMSLSKTHAQFHLAPDGVLVVMDRGSTNGSVLVRQGVDRDLAAGKPATLLDGDLVRFGDREMTVSRVG